MKITIDEKPTKTTPLYPCLMKNSFGTIVFFVTPMAGTAINGDSAGYHCSGWHMPEFTPFNGSVTLSNG